MTQLILPGVTRSTPKIERSENSKPSISGLGAVFHRESDPGTEFWLWEDVVERIRPGAFDNAVKNAADVRACFNHDANLILGRTASGTMSLAITSEGLTYRVTPPDSPHAQGVLASVERGDVSGSSFMFIPTRTVWEELRTGDTQVWVRWIEDVELFEVGPVVFPAYASTTATSSARSNEGAQVAPRYREWLTRHVDAARAEFRRDVLEPARERRMRQRSRVSALGKFFFS